MTTSHAVFELIGGDDWEISAELLDENGNPYDLSAAQVKWTLVNNAGQQILDDDDVAIAIVNAAAGTCLITVAATTTTTLAGGRYSDALRIVTGGVTSTLCLGPIQVVIDPWKVQATTASTGRLRVVA
jgi:hypothetical protein